MDDLKNGYYNHGCSHGQQSIQAVYRLPARMHEEVSQFRSLLGDKGQRLGQVVFAHGGLEIGK